MKFVARRFKTFLGNLALTNAQRSDGITKHTGVRTCLNRHYYGVSSGYANSLLVGSWGKSTEIRPPRDIDILFVLPTSVYERFERRPYGSNRQSELLQEVKGVLAKTYSTTRLRGDGQVVVVPFSSYAVEVVPAFSIPNGRFWICDTNGGGTYKETDPNAEKEEVSRCESLTNGDARSLIRMAKCWQSYCSVPLSSFQLELVAIQFLDTWENAGKGPTWYDWMVRDFLAYLISKKNSWLFAPGTYRSLPLGDAWLSRAKSALGRAEKACEYEAADKDFDAGWEWQKIFGSQIPLTM